ncbi:UNVERIFIED_CONTAM: hypothetical protein HDU68_003123 [Siphonaria sp. JEL0065]|nr:hypothetical protein HDU68_003123 [Siphonaria sp. JEL0065]
MNIFEGRKEKAARECFDAEAANAERKRSVAAAVAKKFSKICLNGGSNHSRRQTALHSSKNPTSSPNLASSNQNSVVDPKTVIQNFKHKPSVNFKQLLNTETFLAPIAASNTPSSRQNSSRLSPRDPTAKSKVSHERVLELWGFLRSHIIKKPPAMLQLLLASNAAAPYPLTIKQGFQFKYRLRTKYQIKCLIMHSKLPWHQPDSMLDDHSPPSSLDKHSKSVVHRSSETGTAGEFVNVLAAATSSMNISSGDAPLVPSNNPSEKNAVPNQNNPINTRHRLSMGALTLQESTPAINVLEEYIESSITPTSDKLHASLLPDDEELETKRAPR